MWVSCPHLSGSANNCTAGKDNVLKKYYRQETLSSELARSTFLFPDKNITTLSETKCHMELLSSIAGAQRVIAYWKAWEQRVLCCQAGTFVRAVPRELVPPGPVVLLLSRDLEVRAQTPETQRYLRTLVPPTPGQPPVPASAYNVAAQLLASEAGIDRNRPVARVPPMSSRRAFTVDKQANDTEAGLGRTSAQQLAQRCGRGSG